MRYSTQKRKKIRSYSDLKSLTLLDKDKDGAKIRKVERSSHNVS